MAAWVSTQFGARQRRRPGLRPLIAWADGRHAVFGGATEFMDIGTTIDAMMVFACTATYVMAKR